MVVVSITIPADLLKRFDDFKKVRGYFSRSEAVRDAMRSLISEADLLMPKAEKVVAIIMAVSDSTRRDVTVRLSRITCELTDIIAETLHRKIGDKHCLTIFVAEGALSEMNILTGRIRGMHGIQEVKTLLIST